jgi:hypothetical protein
MLPSLVQKGKPRVKKCVYREENYAISPEETSGTSSVILMPKGSLRVPGLAVPCSLSISHSCTLELLS